MTPPDPQQVAEIAGRLSRHDRDVVILEGIVLGMPFSALVMRPLIRRGFFERVERKGFQATWALTPLGLAVRTFIQGTHHD